jgi:putative tryptophan/tyrosine transport system substrate-binding protein
MKHRAAAVLALTVALSVTLGWAGESQGEEKISRVGILTFIATTDDPTLKQWMEPFRRTLALQGWVEGKNVVFEYRSALGDPSQLAEAAAELVRLKVDVIWAAGAPFARAAYTATRTIPIVATDFTTDPVAEGYVQSHGRPGGNLTGVFLDAPEFAGKWFQLLNAMVPGLSRVAVLWDPSPGRAHLEAVQNVARSLRVQLQVLEVRKPEDIDRAFSVLRGRPQALIVLPSPMLYRQIEQLAELAVKHRLPATSMNLAFAKVGGMIGYGPNVVSTSDSAALLVAKILAGAKPAELPVERPTKVQLVINLKTAKALGLAVPESVLYRADEIIR